MDIEIQPLKITARYRANKADVLDSVRQYKKEKKNGTLIGGKALKDIIY